MGTNKANEHTIITDGEIKDDHPNSLPFGGHGEKFGRVHHAAEVESEDLPANSHRTHADLATHISQLAIAVNRLDTQYRMFPS